MECKPAKSTYYDPYTMTETECWPGCPTVCGFDEMTCPGAYDGIKLTQMYDHIFSTIIFLQAAWRTSTVCPSQCGVSMGKSASACPAIQNACPTSISATWDTTLTMVTYFICLLRHFTTKYNFNLPFYRLPQPQGMQVRYRLGYGDRV